MKFPNLFNRKAIKQLKVLEHKYDPIAEINYLGSVGFSQPQALAIINSIANYNRAYQPTKGEKLKN